jgi:type VI secretion system protein ImpH
VSLAEDLERAPFAHDLLLALRRIERGTAEYPRIGDSAARREDAVTLGQDPYLNFPASTLAAANRDASGRLRLIVKFLGMLGPQGPLPLATTDETYGWLLENDDAFPRFLDVFNHRFLQLFYRAWADARPIAQAERPADDRFAAYVGAFVGLGSQALGGLKAVESGRHAYAGLLAPAARSASRLRNAITGLLHVEVEVDEFVGSFLEFEAADRSHLGQLNVRLGQDLLLGRSVFSVEDRIRLRVFAADLDAYERLLPGGTDCRSLADLVFFYLGDALEWEMELALPVEQVQPVRLGRCGRVGYTTWVGSGTTPFGETFRRDARFQPAERVGRAQGLAEHG